MGLTPIGPVPPLGGIVIASFPVSLKVSRFCPPRPASSWNAGGFSSASFSTQKPIPRPVSGPSPRGPVPSCPGIPVVPTTVAVAAGQCSAACSTPAIRTSHDLDGQLHRHASFRGVLLAFLALLPNGRWLKHRLHSKEVLMLRTYIQRSSTVAAIAQDSCPLLNCSTASLTAPLAPR